MGYNIMNMWKKMSFTVHLLLPYKPSKSKKQWCPPKSVFLPSRFHVVPGATPAPSQANITTLMAARPCSVTSHLFRTNHIPIFIFVPSFPLPPPPLHPDHTATVTARNRSEVELIACVGKVYVLTKNLTGHLLAKRRIMLCYACA